VQRRKFFQLGASAGLAALPAAGAANTQIIATGDGVPHSTAEYTALLAKLNIERDNFSRDGVVAELEKRVAASLGKEAAVWMPTGTLANHVAVRILAGNSRRVLVQQESHLYNDCGDCAQTLSGLHLVGLAPGKATFTLSEVESWAQRGSGSRVDVPIGALQIETPVRRKDGQRFVFDEMKKITAWARQNKVGTHLDGARLFLESAYSGIAAKDYAAMFDTVYVSMYKNFNAASGAVLAGPKDLLANLYHTRRMFGGGLNGVWPFAAVANHYYQGYEERIKKAVQTSEAAIATMVKDGNFEIERIPEGTNIFRFRVRGVNALVYQQRLLHAGITVSAPVNEWFLIRVNDTWNRAANAAEIVERFRTAMG
jgi:threonine aldolase